MIAPAFPATRSEALARLDEFLPIAGRDYAERRNYDQGPGRHQHVSRLSVALRTRLVAEDEAIAALVRAHAPGAADKFVSEIFWRTYWKGWLESRPAIWDSFLADRAAAIARLGEAPDLAARFEQARNGQTGIDCFDAWTRELLETGYLHNWARMQYASIWLFTLRLPLALGAAFTYHHFIDADPASNTLSWRWVAGLHSKGKAYLADAERIRAMTDGRFDPVGLARETGPLCVDTPPDPRDPRRAEPLDPAAPSILLVTPEDLSMETRDLPPAIHGAVALRIDAPDRPRMHLLNRALDDAAGRIGRHLAMPVERATPQALSRQILALCTATGARQLVTARAAVGPVHALLESMRPDLAASGIRLAEIQRDWDRRTWPHCTRGYFALRQKIGGLIGALPF